jgi:hypothetical protein
VLALLVGLVALVLTAVALGLAIGLSAVDLSSASREEADLERRLSVLCRPAPDGT